MYVCIYKKIPFSFVKSHFFSRFLFFFPLQKTMTMLKEKISYMTVSKMVLAFQ